MLDFRVETFLTVCQVMNYTKAAEQLNLTQPAVSQHIHWLEQQYGVKLFSYQNKILSLTSAGKQLQSAFTTIQHDLQYLSRNIKHEKQVLRFGVTPTVGSYLIPKPLTKFHKQFPDIQIHMKVGNTEKLCEELDKGNLDFAIVEGYVRKQDYDALLYQVEPYIAVCASDLILPCNIKKLSDLVTETLLIREEGSGNREIILRSLSRHNVSLSDFKSVLQLNDLHAIKALICAGAGIGFLYHSAVKQELAQGSMKQIPLEDFQEKHEITFIWQKNSIYAQQYKQIHKILQHTDFWYHL